MVAYLDEEKLLMHFFQDSLSGASLEWYMKLTHTYIWTWRELEEAFLKYYQYNTDMAPKRTQLQSFTQNTDDSFKEYPQRWKELDPRVQPPLLERELFDMFIGTLQSPYLDRMVRSSSYGFAYLVVAGEWIENHLKNGKLKVLPLPPMEQRNHISTFQRRRKGKLMPP